MILEDSGNRFRIVLVPLNPPVREQPVAFTLVCMGCPWTSKNELAFDYLMNEASGHVCPSRPWWRRFLS